MTEPTPPPEPEPERQAQSALFLDELGRLLDAVFDADRGLAVAAAGRAVAIDAARLHSERTDLGVSAVSPELTRRSLIGELACGLRIPDPTAAKLLEESRALVHTLPDTLAALGAGRIGYRNAQTLVHETYALPLESARELEGTVLSAAGRLSPSQFDRKVRTVRERLDPDAISFRHVRSVADRSLTVTPARDGMCWLTAYLAAADGIAIHNRVTTLAMALQGPNEHRTLTQLRPDVFRDLILDPAPASQAPGGGTDRFRGTKPDLIVTVPMLTLLGVTEEPGNLDGYGPIDPDTARDLASLCPTAIRILTHPETGATLSVGRDRYIVPADLKRLLEIRDSSCRSPYCSRPARQTDLDHTIDWQYKGESAHDNLAHVCRGAHILKHEAGWRYTQATDGSGALTWTTPTGHVYTTEPETPIGSAINDALRKKATLRKNAAKGHGSADTSAANDPGQKPPF